MKEWTLAQGSTSVDIRSVSLFRTVLLDLYPYGVDTDLYEEGVDPKP